MIASVASEHKIVIQLLDDETVTPVGLAALRRESEINGLPLVEVLMAHDTVSDADAARVYADMNGLRFLDLSRRKPSSAWTLTLPENIA
ncbi:MAG: hypothetical protein ACE5EX_11680, partial [Phycisphaerae bacterium]